MGCNMPRHSGPILPFNCNSRSRSGGHRSRASKAGEKYSHLEDSQYFVPIAIETLGAGSSWVHWGGSCVMTLGLVYSIFLVGVFVIIIVAFFFLSSVCSIYSSGFYFY